jgi:hypothetical protein
MRLVYDRRKALLNAGVDHWLKDLPAVGGYPVLMVIDELTELLTAHAYGEDQKSAKARLDRIRVALSSIARLGRFVGVHLLVGLQRPDASILGGGELRDNLTARLALGTMSADGLRMVFGAAAAGQAMPSQPGRGLVVGIPPALTSPLECAVPMPSATEFEAALGGREAALVGLSNPRASFGKSRPLYGRQSRVIEGPGTRHPLERPAATEMDAHSPGPGTVET